MKGIGQKGGSRLLQEFETLEGVFAGLEGVANMDIRGSKGLQALLRYEACRQRIVASSLHDTFQCTTLQHGV